MRTVMRCPSCGAQYDVDPAINYCNACAREGLDLVEVEAPPATSGHEPRVRGQRTRRTPSFWLILFVWLTVGGLYAMGFDRVAPAALYALTAVHGAVTLWWLYLVFGWVRDYWFGEPLE